MHQLTIPRGSTIEFEAARVAAAFGVQEWSARNGYHLFWYGCNQGIRCHWCVDLRHEFKGLVSYISTGDGAGNGWDVYRTEKGWAIYKGSDAEASHLMARGLYCLGFDDAAILAQLPPLTMHEKIEARLTMPREFWPQKWLDELENSPQKS